MCVCVCVCVCIHRCYYTWHINSYIDVIWKSCQVNGLPSQPYSPEKHCLQTPTCTAAVMTQQHYTDGPGRIL